MPSGVRRNKLEDGAFPERRAEPRPLRPRRPRYRSVLNERAMTQPRNARLLPIITLATAGLLASGGWNAVSAQSGHTQRAIAQAQSLSEAFTSVADKVSPAVVSLKVEAARPAMGPFGAMGPRHFAQGGGSGVIIRSNGYILTNNHVVEGARRIDVVLKNGRTLRGEVVGTDPDVDLAVVKVNATGLTAAPFADSDSARVGEWVVAIGSPFGLDYTVTAGVLSAKGRGGLRANEIEDYLQTDASINPGNSGGPLVNLRGEVLGINTMIIGQGTGIGFAIPSDMARHVADQLVDNGQVRRAWLGVGFQELTPELAKQMGVRARSGALINQVAPDGPARKAGVQTGDIIVSVAGREVAEGRDLLRHVVAQEVGKSVRIEVLRDGRKRTLTVKMGERPSSSQGESRDRGRRDGQSNAVLGMSLDEMTDSFRTRLDYSGPAKTVVTSVEPGSPAARANLQRGDIILRADEHRTPSVSQIRRAASDGAVLLRVQRGEGSVFVALSKD